MSHEQSYYVLADIKQIPLSLISFTYNPPTFEVIDPPTFEVIDRNLLPFDHGCFLSLEDAIFHINAFFASHPEFYDPDAMYRIIKTEKTKTGYFRINSFFYIENIEKNVESRIININIF